MGCKRATKRAFKWFWSWVKPEVMKAAVTIVTAFEGVSVEVMTGNMKQDVAVDYLKKVALDAGQELSTSAARTIINGVHTMMRNGQDVADLGQPDDEDVPDPED